MLLVNQDVNLPDEVHDRESLRAQDDDLRYQEHNTCESLRSSTTPCWQASKSNAASPAQASPVPQALIVCTAKCGRGDEGVTYMQ